MSKILVTDPLHQSGLDVLRAKSGLVVDVATDLSEQDLIERIVDYDALLVRSKTKANARVIDAAKNLKAIGRAGIGVDNIDVEKATSNGIVVFNTPDANATTTAELAIAHMMSLSRHLPHADRSVRNGEWTPTKFVGTEVFGKTVGIVGFGTIGRLVAERCVALKMTVLAFDPFVTEEILKQYNAESCSLMDLVARADYVTLHCPLLPDTKNVIDAVALAAMKPTARLINCARGGLVDEAALIDALDQGKLAGAALDVFANEPPKDSPLLSHSKVVLTPHLGASTAEAQEIVSLRVAEAVSAFLETGEAQSAINLPRISAEQLNQTQPYQKLAYALGRLIGSLTDGAISELVVRGFGRVAKLDMRPITTECLVGLLTKQVAERVNRVNATHLANQHGISVREARSEDAKDYVSLVEISATSDTGTTRVAGALLGGSHPRLVRINNYSIEAVPEGTVLFTRHNDQPGVVGALGSLLGREGINIERMQVGKSDEGKGAIALIAISGSLSQTALDEIRSFPAIQQAVQIEL